ncbi:MAG: hypothetical protein ACLQVJ_06125 [Syntrophobacteraceae bacterium]
MKKTVFILFVVLGLLLGIAMVPTFIRAAEFSYAGPPAFTVTYPDGSKPDKTTAPEQVWAIKTPERVTVQAGVAPIPEGIALKDYAEKSYKPGLESSEKTKATMITNKEYELADGTKAYYTEMEWMWHGTTLLTTVMVAAYKDGRMVYVTSHPWASLDEPKEIVRSLKFK